MAKVTPVLWVHQSNADGHHPLWLRFQDNRRTLYLSLATHIHPRHWNKRVLRVRKGHPCADEINEVIERRLADAERARLRMLADREPITAEALKAAAAGDPGGRVDFFAYVEGFLVNEERGGNIQRAKKERAVLAKLKEFCGPTLPFSHINLRLIQEWETFLRIEKKNKNSTIQAAISVVRLHFNRAIRSGLVEAGASPFIAYSAPRAAPPDRSKLTMGEIAKIEAVDLGPGGPRAKGQRKVRDWFLFAFYTGGMRFSDVIQLKRSDIIESAGGDGKKGYRVRYRMGKTGKLADVVLVSQAVAVISPYLDRPADAYLFDALDRYRTDTPAGLNKGLRSRNGFANRRLGMIATKAGISKPVTFHVARHSFADIARRQGWSLYDVSRALRHSNLKITDGYLASFDGEALDSSMQSLFNSQ